MAALCHEMAHIRRRDYLVNLLCEAAALPLNSDPVIYGVERCIRRTREMVCDAMAAEAMESEMAYGEAPGGAGAKHGWAKRSGGAGTGSWTCSAAMYWRRG